MREDLGIKIIYTKLINYYFTKDVICYAAMMYFNILLAHK